MNQPSETTETITRRDFTHQALGSLLAFSFMQWAAGRDLFADNVKPPVTKWLSEVNQLGWDLKGQMLKQTEWQKQIETLYTKADVPSFLKLIDFEKLTKDLKLEAHGEKSLRVKFPQVEGIPAKLAFGQQIFALKQGASVVPHGHNNMATAFLMLDGEFHGRHYDRVQDEKEHILIRPTIDRKFTLGECSTVSDDKDNVHWFKALSPTAFIYNIHVMDVRPGSKLTTGRVYLDPNGEKLGDGLIRAKRVDYDTVHKLYG